jgi:putative transposase
VIMPNHVHGIIVLNETADVHCRGTLQRAPTFERFGKPTHNSISTIVRLFKSITTKRINQIQQSFGTTVWQRGFYDHIIRNEQDLNNIREYIMNNPLKWWFDEENPVKKKYMSPKFHSASYNTIPCHLTHSSVSL